HHSNLLAFNGSIGRPHARAETVSAANFGELIYDAGGAVLIQELINWGDGTVDLHDCLTLFARSALSTPVTISNPRFMDDADIIRGFKAPYCTSSFFSGFEP